MVCFAETDGTFVTKLVVVDESFSSNLDILDNLALMLDLVGVTDLVGVIDLAVFIDLVAFLSLIVMSVFVLDANCSAAFSMVYCFWLSLCDGLISLNFIAFIGSIRLNS